MIWEVRNGYVGNTAVTVIVEAPDRKKAERYARQKFYDECHPRGVLGETPTQEANYWTPDENWSFQQVTLPYFYD